MEGEGERGLSTTTLSVCCQQICRTNTRIFHRKAFENMSLEASESLRQQFQLIQEQQQRKLLARKQRKTKNSEKAAKEDEDVPAENFWGHDGHTDNLDLKVCVIFDFLLLLCVPYDKYDYDSSSKSLIVSKAKLKIF